MITRSLVHAGDSVRLHEITGFRGLDRVNRRRGREVFNSFTDDSLWVNSVRRPWNCWIIWLLWLRSSVGHHLYGTKLKVKPISCNILRRVWGGVRLFVSYKRRSVQDAIYNREMFIFSRVIHFNFSFKLSYIASSSRRLIFILYLYLWATLSVSAFSFALALARSSFILDTIAFLVISSVGKLIIPKNVW